ncbi:hypothetical protein [Streptomyces hebeiensis]
MTTQPERGWSLQRTEHAARVLEAMRAGGYGETYRAVVLFVRALAIEAGNAVAAGKGLPGLPVGDGGRYVIDVPRLPVLVSYRWFPGTREFRVLDLVWIDVGCD